MALDISAITKEMLGAALPILASGGEKAVEYAEAQFKKIALQIVSIGEDYATGKLTEDGAKALLEMQENSTKIVLLTVEGLSLIVVEEAINAALSVVKGVVNTALG